MKDLNTQQLKAIEKTALNAGTVVLGTLILGGAISPQSFKWLYFILGIILYTLLFWLTLKVNETRKKP